MSLLDTARTTVSCPYCGESLEILLDPSDPTDEYIEDCQVCCRPITMRVVEDGGERTVMTLTEDEY